MRRNWSRGWLRLWIVGALFWGLYWIWQIYPASCNKMYDLAYGTFYRCYTKKGVVFDYSDEYIFGWLIVPPVTVFVLGLIAPWLVSWIIRGFRSTPPRSAD
jgi:hypothetical protein